MPNGCPNCPLTVAAGALYTGWPGNNHHPGYDGLADDWLLWYDDRLEPPEEREYQAALARVTAALGFAPDADSPVWSRELAALVEAYRSERAHVRRELEWACRPKPAKPPGG